MKSVFGFKGLLRRYRKPVVALGVFDGVHRGHRNILEAAVRKARSIGGTSMVLTFWPHPERQESLYSLEHRLRLIGALGIDVCVVINFNKKFAQTSADNFVKDILAAKLGAHYIYVGKNFRFGKGAKGDCRTLKRLSGIYNFKPKFFTVAKAKGRPISSTCIRALIKKGKLAGAQRLLSRPVSILGTVIRGSFLGRRLGFPTANINPHHEVIPPSGVYAVHAIFNARKFRGICYIGNKPTFKNKKSPQDTQIEVHIFNFNKNIYGKYLEIQFDKRIRAERKFATTAALVKQIKKDILSL